MARSKPIRLTANQIVAHNLREARRQLGWTQEQAAEQLARVTGERWSKSTFSSAENPQSKRTRHFDADLLYALALTFTGRCRTSWCRRPA